MLATGPAPEAPDSSFGLLDDVERGKALAFRSAEDRHSYIAAHALLRRVLSGLSWPDAVTRRPQDWRFAAGPFGKPELQAGQLGADLRFNLSHTHGMVAVVLCLGMDVGIDVESMERRVADDMAIAEAYFSPPEQAWLRAMGDPAGRRLGFMDLWTAKEAFIKALGHGLSMPLDSFSVDLERGCYVEKCLPAEARDRSWSLTRWRSGAHLVALAVGASHAAHAPCIVCGVRGSSGLSSGELTLLAGGSPAATHFSFGDAKEK